MLPQTRLSALGFDPDVFQTEPPACNRASRPLPGPDSLASDDKLTNQPSTAHAISLQLFLNAQGGGRALHGKVDM